ncbi:MAG: hypothetical protein AB1896_22895, partial [Thermodesulfobacteriota bacterium]
SVLSTELDRPQGLATLRPLVFGRDAADNLAAHLDLFHQEGLAGVFFEMDLDRAWQAGFTPALLGLGFTPRLVIPYAGRGDLVVFQLEIRNP